MARAYYNEWDPHAAGWLRNLIAAGLVPPGDVDDRSIADVRPEDLDGYTQCHFFAGIAGWSLALRLAGWPDERPVWTGSCPCQPFSLAGAQKGFDDHRHLWPQFRRLIEERRPPTVFGEQVASASDWLRLVRRDLEAMAYAVGAVPIEAASAGADHRRDRYWFVADRDFEAPGRDWVPGGGGLVGPDAEDRPLSHLPRQRGDGGEGASRAAGRHGAQDIRPGHVVRDPGLGWGGEWTENELRARGLDAAVALVDGRRYFECLDGKWRRLPPPGVRWLGHGIPARVAKLRAFGNAIDPRPAAQFIAAWMDVEAGTTTADAVDQSPAGQFPGGGT